jgi:hypothetical protein
MDKQEEKEFVRSILELTGVSTRQIDRSAVVALIKKYQAKPLNGLVRNWTTQLECLLDIFKSPTLSFEDLMPDLDQESRRRMIWDKFEKFLAGNFEDEDSEPYRIYTKYIIYNSKRIEVKELCRENFGFILFRAVDGNDYYLDVVLNQSFAYWNETCMVPAADAETFLNNPGYANARELLARYKSPKIISHK